MTRLAGSLKIALLLASLALSSGAWAIDAAPKIVSGLPPIAVPASTIPPTAGLEALKTSGFAVIQPGPLLTPAAAALVLDQVDAHRSGVQSFTGDNWVILDEFSPEWRINRYQTAELVAQIRGFAEGLRDRLQETLPEEPLVLRNAWLKLGTKQHQGAVPLHIDGGYLTATLSLRGQGTRVYAPQLIAAPPGALAVITAKYRDWMTGVPSTVHSAPVEDDDSRILLMARYDRVDLGLFAQKVREQIDDLAELRLKRVEAALRAARRGKAP